MDGIEKITGRIAADTEAEIASIQAEARRQADEITARYEAQAKREAEEIAARGRRSAEERQARLASVAQLDARKLELAAKQEMLAKEEDFIARFVVFRGAKQHDLKAFVDQLFRQFGVVIVRPAFCRAELCAGAEADERALG